MAVENRNSRSRSGEDENGDGRSSLFVGSTEKAFQVLHAFYGPHREMTLTEIARAVGLDRSAVQRAVHTLEVLGYVRRVAETRNYRLTAKVLQFSYSYLRANELIERASPYLLDLSRNLGETTNLLELDGHEIVFLARFPGKHLLNVDIVVGSRLPALFTASGTTIVSQRSAAEQQEILKRTPLVPMTPHTQTDPAALMERIRAAAEKGYSVITNETVMGDISVAAPILDDYGVAVAAINISVPTSRWTPERAEIELAPQVQVAGTSISRSKFGRYAY